MKLKKSLFLLLPIVAITGFILFNAFKKTSAADNAGLTLPEGFKATMIVESMPGGVREMAPTPEGDIYVKIYRIRRGATTKGIVLLHDDGEKATVKTSFGDF